MCGIVGFLAKTPELRANLGEFVVPMLTCMGDRGPDSAGLAVFESPTPGLLRRYSLFVPRSDYNWSDLRGRLMAHFGGEINLIARERHALFTAGVDAATFRRHFESHEPELHLLSAGRSISMFKDEGHPKDISDSYGFTKLTGTHSVGHTRMATESAVSPAHAHPFTAGEDFCLVHNGSLSNPYSIRRKLEKKGIRFETDNDTEAACRFLEWRMREGNTLEEALRQGFEELDGFFTLLMATANKLVLVRDPFACKPAVVAETDDYVAISSEYRALAHLPNARQANIFEPVPEQIYSWTV
ncbi:MAG: class II glutamine amidotransferase [Planctomycetota bacterium]|nr:class II glutamine amidotransferase [Planctomycetota bacterium]